MFIYTCLNIHQILGKVLARNRVPKKMVKMVGLKKAAKRKNRSKTMK